jgi:hypothetical protein
VRVGACREIEKGENAPAADFVLPLSHGRVALESIRAKPMDLDTASRFCGR